MPANDSMDSRVEEMIEALLELLVEIQHSKPQDRERKAKMAVRSFDGEVARSEYNLPIETREAFVGMMMSVAK